MRSLAIQERLVVESLLLYIERSQLRWFGHLVRTPRVSDMSKMGEDHEADPGHTGGITSLSRPGNTLVSELEKVVG